MNKGAEEIYQCDNCYAIFEPYGDDYWLECPYCRSDKYSRFVMKLFQERQIREAYEFAAAGGQALHLFNDPGVYPGAPMCFKKSREAAHLFDMNTKRLIATAQQLGVRVIKLGREDTPKQHVDLCGRPLKQAIELCNLILPKTPQDAPGRKQGYGGDGQRGRPKVAQN